MRLALDAAMDWTRLVLLCAITMGMAHTISRERLFEPLRTRLGGKETFTGYLVSCPYCCSHWIAFILVPVTGSYFFDVAFDVPVLTPLVRLFLSAILVTVGAAFLRVGFYWIDETQSLVRKRKEASQEVAAEAVRASQPVYAPPARGAPLPAPAAPARPARD
jgi:hypothetical protein